MEIRGWRWEWVAFGVEGAQYYVDIITQLDRNNLLCDICVCAFCFCVIYPLHTCRGDFVLQLSIMYEYFCLGNLSAHHIITHTHVWEIIL